MAKKNEIRDGAGPAKSVAEMRESQRKGSESIGLNEKSFIDNLRDYHQAPSINGQEE